MAKEKTKRKTLFLVDGYAMLYRAHFAFIRNPLFTSYGLPTSALFGFSNQLLNLIKKENPDYIAAVFDTAEKTFRHKKYPEYKATREKMPEELREQLPHLWNILNAMQITTLSKAGFEADDIIGTLAQWESKHDLDVFIVSGDKDFMQLINDHIFMYTSSGRNFEPKIIARDGVIEKWGVPPEKIIDLMGLMGDASDNIPGVSGVGKVSAKKLILEYGSLEESLDNADKIANKRVREGLQNNSKNAHLSKDLVTIDINVELNCNLAELKRTELDIEALSELYQQFEFSGLLKQLPNFQVETIPDYDEPVKHYITITNYDDLKSFIGKIKSSDTLSIDLETTSVDPMLAEIVGFSFSMKKDNGFYIPIEYKDKLLNNFGDDDLQTVLSVLKPIFENDKIIKIGQNIKYDALILKRSGINVNGIKFDTMIASHLVSPEARSYKLDNLSLEYLNYRMVSIEELIGTGKNQITMDEVELEKVSFYAVEDADVTLQLYEILKDKLIENGLSEYYEQVELPLIKVLLELENNGVFVDKVFLKSMSEELGNKIVTLNRDIYKEAGMEFNINSTQQLANILFDVKGLRKIRKRSTAEEVLKQLVTEDPLPGLMLEYRKFNKLKNTYLDPFPELINPTTKRIHSSFTQTVAATGRLSSQNPNFQNIPIKTTVGREMRKAFRSQQKGWKILSADYSQIELRIMAHLSKDSELIKAFENNEDVHSRTASSIFGVPIKDVLPEMRRTAKVVNFGIMYGAGPFRMSQELGIPRSEAQVIIDEYFKQYSGIQNYIDETLEMARSKKYVETILGRRRPVWDIDSDNHIRKEAAKRMAINMPIQGTAAEMIKKAMISIHNNIQSGNKNSGYNDAKMILQVHDELLFEVPENQVKLLTKMVIYEMENALPISVPIVVDCGVGDSWFEAH
ncbi:MAG: DNA polymerase I [Candidatus Neomarinimicrobiota bacterium]